MTEIIKGYHEDMTNHRAINETKSQLRKRFYRPSIKNDIENFINACKTCQINKYERNSTK